MLLQLTVEIIDNGTVETIDHARSSVGHINITVRDINDHIPRFTDRVNFPNKSLASFILFHHPGASSVY